MGATRDRLAREKDPVERAVLESATSDEALLADLKAEAGHASARLAPEGGRRARAARGCCATRPGRPRPYKEAEQRRCSPRSFTRQACPGPFGGHDLAERARDPTKRPRPLQRRAQAIVEKGAYEDFVRRSGSYGDDDRSFRVEKRGARRVQLYSRRLAFECCTNSLCGALFKAQAEDVRETRLDRLHLPEGATPGRTASGSELPPGRGLVAAVAAAWLVAVTSSPRRIRQAGRHAEKRLGNLEATWTTSMLSLIYHVLQ